MRNDSTSPTPFTLASASFQHWLEPNHLLQTCSPAGFLVPQPVSLTKEGRNVPNLPVRQSSWTGMKLNSTNLGFFTVKKVSFISQLIPVYSCYSAISAGQTLQTSEAGVSPLGQSVQTCPDAEGRRVLPGAGLALGFSWLTRLSLLGIQAKLSNANVGLVLPHLKEEGSPWLTSSILLGLKWERLSQSFICILSETVRIWLELHLIYFPQLFSCSFLLSALSSVAKDVLLLILSALLNKPWP